MDAPSQFFPEPAGSRVLRHVQKEQKAGQHKKERHADFRKQHDAPEDGAHYAPVGGNLSRHRVPEYNSQREDNLEKIYKLSVLNRFSHCFITFSSE